MYAVYLFQSDLWAKKSILDFYPSHQLKWILKTVQEQKSHLINSMLNFSTINTA